MPRAPLAILAALAAMALADLALCHAFGLSFTHWGRVVPVTLAIAGLGAFYRWSGRSERIARAALWVSLWIAFSATAAIMTYLAAARGGLWCDASFAALDRALGFDWNAWFDFVGRHRVLKFALALAYSSLMPQIVLSVLYFAYAGRDERNGELLLNVIVALWLTSAVFSLVPALGPGAEVPALADMYLVDLTGLHDGTIKSFDLTKLNGIVVLPSFHAALATLFTYAHRGGPGFRPVALLNAVMLVSIPSEGGHYLVDEIAGIGVALAAIAAIRAAQIRPWLAVAASSA